MFCVYDLHTHSSASDGTLTPAELVHRAAAAGVRCLALTDHDTLDGISAAQATAVESGIQFVPGVEISVTWHEHSVHVVGLGVDCAAPALAEGLANLRAFRAWRAEEIGQRLAQQGIPNAYAGARALAKGRLVGRTHFARYLVQCGVMRDEREVFKHYLIRGKPGYVTGQWAVLEEALAWIHSAGGQAVLAHPARYPFTAGMLRRLLEVFKSAGGVALEVVSGSHGRDDILNMAQYARTFGLLSSAGSDYHGPENPWIHLGQLPNLPERCVPLWHDWPPLLTHSAVA